ncbi:bifunctional DNA-formamidopyrimidine glycosylase/DNA-(apurinic or apyrimidinic site) lyase [Thalassotalea agarivorans]|uniref:Formamidopyrimidine-DNA glycosylase n=1 Tax=Thalassotalea agarivorans TaxID=349064 RepID=A0A1I0CNZ6_THASX|nr:bifunctional DNA-formamidopyrimidine glycosylase/DNA-(apurinic or apyrimidinic site) lyase [Thalassotalea agarivorans]SET20738.1 DNA-(apurinic or apyrimidinic site) lyase [Thalassotalea agarivorans]
MPELPEVEVCRLGISPHIQDQTITDIVVRQWQLRWPIPEEVKTITGQKVVSVKRRSKYLLIAFNTGTLVLHLGMSGTLRILPTKTQPVKHDHVDIHFDNGVMLKLNDPRRFGAVLWLPEHQDVDGILAKLGPEPLTEAFNGDYLADKAKNRTTAIKQFIMNNPIVVGVGNIYANESLFMAGIRPDAQAGKLSKKRLTLLVDCIKQVLEKAIAQGGTTLKDFTQSDGKPGYFAQELQIYGKAGKPCPKCQSPLMEIRQSGRSSVFCKSCQKK